MKNKANNIPVFMTIRETARTGILPEVCLRRMVKQGEIPGIYSGTRFLVNYTALVEKLSNMDCVLMAANK